MGSTPVYGWPYETRDDPPAGYARRRALALAIEATVQSIDQALAADPFVIAGDLTVPGSAQITGDLTVDGDLTVPAVRPDAEASNGAVLDRDETDTYVGHDASGMTFVAPPSGIVRIDWFDRLEIAVGSSGLFRRMYSSVQTRAGGTIGSGTIEQDFSNSEAITIDALSGERIGFGGSTWRIVTGLTPGTTYNVRPGHRVSATGAMMIGQSNQRRILVTRQP